jgi:hypothetical protein
MKYLFYICSCLLWVSCSKDNISPPPDSAYKDIASQYIGDYNVSETTNDWWTGILIMQTEFTGQVYRDFEGIQNLPIGMDLRDTLNVVAFDQEDRPAPAPAWALPGRGGFTSAGILTYKFYNFNGKDSIMGIPGTTTDGRIVSKDTLLIHYVYGAGDIYDVTQIWVKKK